MGKFSFLFLAVIMLAYSFSTARASIAPPPLPDEGGLQPYGIQKTNVQMISADVEMELQTVSISGGGEAVQEKQVAVTAWYVMRNQGAEAETIQVVYPLDAFSPCLAKNAGGLLPNYSYLDFFPQSFSVTVDGAPALLSTLISEHPYGSEGGCQSMRWAAFEASFPIDRHVLIKLEYLLKPAGGSGAVENMEYALAPAAGWRLAIPKIQVSFRFPYLVEDNVLRGTTRGYQTSHNEIIWTLHQVEPDSSSNIQISFIAPETWQTIQNSRARIRANASDVEAYEELAQSYAAISSADGSSQRQAEYRELAFRTYLRGITNNPDSPNLYLDYIDLYLFDCCSFTPPTQYHLDRILPRLHQVLKLDPANRRALALLDRLRKQVPNLAYTPPAEVSAAAARPPADSPPAATATPSATPTLQPSPTQTAVPAHTHTAAAILTSTPTGTSTAAAVSSAELPAQTQTLTRPSSTPAGSATTALEVPITGGRQISRPNEFAMPQIVAISSVFILFLTVVVVSVRTLQKD